MPVPVIAERNAGQDRLNLRTPEPFSVGNAGAIGDGLADDYNALFEAAKKQGTSGAIFLPPGTYAVGTSLTIACQVIFAFGAKLKPDTGVTVTLAGPVTTAPGDGIIAIGTGGTVNVTGPLNASGVIDVRTFGAKGDGTSNDTPAFQAAIDALLGTGGKVFVPAGSYYLATPVSFTPSHNSITIEGPAMGRGTSPSNPVRILAGTTAFQTVGATVSNPLYGLCLRNLQVSNADENSDHLIKFDGIYTAEFDNIVTSNGAAGKDNFQLTNFADVLFDNYRVAGSGRHGLNIGDAVANNASTTIRMIGGYIRNCRGAGVYGVGADQMSHVAMYGTLFEANGRDEFLEPIPSAIGCGVILENAEAVDLSVYCEANKNSDVVLGGTVDSSGTVTVGVSCKGVRLGGYFQALSGTATDARIAAHLINVSGIELWGYFSSYTVAHLRMENGGGASVGNVRFGPVTFGSTPSAFVSDAASRIVGGTNPANAFIGTQSGIPTTASVTGVFGAAMSGDGLRVAGNTSAMNVPTGNGWMYFRNDYAERAMYVTDDFYFDQNPRHVEYGSNTQPATLPVGYGRYIVKCDTPANIALPAGSHSGQMLDLVNVGSAALTVSSGVIGGSVVLNEGRGIRLMYSAGVGGWAALDR